MNRKRATVTAIVTVALILIVIYGLLDPASTRFPRCPFFQLTGFKCPGCGSQRAIHQLLHLNIAQAFRYNACLVLFLPVLVFLLVADRLRVRYPRLYAASYNPTFSWSLFAVLMIWFIIRNIFGW